MLGGTQEAWNAACLGIWTLKKRRDFSLDLNWKICRFYTTEGRRADFEEDRTRVRGHERRYEEGVICPLTTVAPLAAAAAKARQKRTETETQVMSKRNMERFGSIGCAEIGSIPFST